MTRSAPAEWRRDASPAGYLRPRWQEAVRDCLPVGWRGARATRWVDRLPMVGVVAGYAATTTALTNTASPDEARAISAGRSVLFPWSTGGLGAPTGSSIHPVLAGLLDAVGGLTLARLFSLACMVLAILALRSATALATASERTGLFAACAFAVAAPVMFVGAIATPDAACIALLAVAARVAVAGRSVTSAALTAVLLTLAVATAYIGVVFVPAVAALTLWHGAGTAVRAARFAGTLVVAAGLLAALFLGQGEPARADARSVLASLTSPVDGRTGEALLTSALLGTGLLVLLAVAGAAVAVRSAAPGRIAGVCGLLAWGLALPVLQALSGGAASFDRHTAFAALFLAPPAGYALAALSRTLFHAVPVVLILLAAVLPGVSRSEALFRQWPDASPVVADIAARPQPGAYLSPDAEVLAYQTRDTLPDVRWDTTASLYAHGRAAVRDAVAQRRYQVVVMRVPSAPGADAEALTAALTLSADYERDPPVAGGWLVYRLVNTLP